METVCRGLEDRNYPRRLYNLSHRPEKIYLRGNSELLDQKWLVAVVGSRIMSPFGMRVVKKIVPRLVDEGIVIVSGMAMGVDAWTQKVCLDCGGKTVAVLASGCGVATPKCNSWLYNRILDKNGLVVSLKGDEEGVMREDFLKRNEVVSGISDMVVVIEGGEHSGTLVTARLAAEQGKEVGAVPGPKGAKNSAATEFLLRNGAILVEDSADILNALI